MITQVKIIAAGETVTGVQESLHAMIGPIEDACREHNGVEGISYGEEVIERDLTQEPYTAFTYKGRLNLHPAIPPTRREDRIARDS